MNVKSSEDRRALIGALQKKGMAAYETPIGDGQFIVTVDLIPNNGKKHLTLMASSIQSDCEFSIGGYRTSRGNVIDCGGQPTSVEMLDTLVGLFEASMQIKRRIIQDFAAGAYG